MSKTPTMSIAVSTLGEAGLDAQLGTAFAFDPPPPALDPTLPADVFAAHRPQAGPARPPAPATPAAAHRRRRRDEEEVLPRGTIVDKYSLDRMLGRGGFAVVYRATHLLLGSAVAIKMLRPRALARQPGLAELLCQEARYAARINHPNVVRVHDVTHNERITYVVMEYIDGRSLAETIHLDGALPPAEVVRVGLGVAAGLRVGLGQGLIHRDIKPANILLPHDGGVKIVDLGLALGSAENDDVAPASRHAVVGTYGYMSPEQAQDPQRVDFRSDIYALGVTLYEAATGTLPFPARDPARCLQMHRHDPVPDPRSRAPGLPDALSALLFQMLAKRPEDRPPSYEALEESLRRALGPSDEAGPLAPVRAVDR